MGVSDVIDAMTFEIDPNDERHEDRIRLLYNRSSTIEPATIQAICRLLQTRYLGFMHDKKATIVAWTGEHFQVDMRDIADINQKGLGDALMAAIVDVFLSNGGRPSVRSVHRRY